MAVTVTGLLDFGDMLHTVTAHEAGVAAAYAMLDQPDPVAAGATVIAGFDSVHRLLDAEVDALPALVLARLGASVAISAHQTRLDPDDPYLRISEAPAWVVLERLVGGPPDDMRRAIRDAIGR